MTFYLRSFLQQGGEQLQHLEPPEGLLCSKGWMTAFGTGDETLCKQREVVVHGETQGGGCVGSPQCDLEAGNPGSVGEPRRERCARAGQRCGKLQYIARDHGLDCQSAQRWGTRDVDLIEPALPGIAQVGQEAVRGLKAAGAVEPQLPGAVAQSHRRCATRQLVHMSWGAGGTLQQDIEPGEIARGQLSRYLACCRRIGVGTRAP